MGKMTDMIMQIAIQDAFRRRFAANDPAAQQQLLNARLYGERTQQTINETRANRERTTVENTRADAASDAAGLFLQEWNTAYSGYGASEDLDEPAELRARVEPLMNKAAGLGFNTGPYAQTLQTVQGIDQYRQVTEKNIRDIFGDEEFSIPAGMTTDQINKYADDYRMRWRTKWDAESAPYELHGFRTHNNIEYAVDKRGYIMGTQTAWTDFQRMENAGLHQATELGSRQFLGERLTEDTVGQYVNDLTRIAYSMEKDPELWGLSEEEAAGAISRFRADANLLLNMPHDFEDPYYLPRGEVEDFDTNMLLSSFSATPQGVQNFKDFHRSYTLAGKDAKREEAEDWEEDFFEDYAAFLEKAGAGKATFKIADGSTVMVEKAEDHFRNRMNARLKDLVGKAPNVFTTRFSKAHISAELPVSQHDIMLIDQVMPGYRDKFLDYYSAPEETSEGDQEEVTENVDFFEVMMINDPSNPLWDEHGMPETFREGAKLIADGIIDNVPKIPGATVRFMRDVSWMTRNAVGATAGLYGDFYSGDSLAGVAYEQRMSDLMLEYFKRRGTYTPSGKESAPWPIQQP